MKVEGLGWCREFRNNKAEVGRGQSAKDLTHHQRRMEEG